MSDAADWPGARVDWPEAWRIIRSIHPPIDLFEDIADPADWEALASAEAKTNPRVAESMGRLDLVPPARRVSGAGASLMMAPFVHCSPDRPGRYTDGTYGVWSAGAEEETAIREVAHHHGRAMAASGEAPGWTSQFRALISGPLNATLRDLRAEDALHDPQDWSAPQAIGRMLREGGADGVLYRSVRHEGGRCIGLFWPDVAPVPRQADHYDMHWDGARTDRLRNRRTGKIYAL